MLIGTLIALYFSVLIPEQEWPLLIGPYETWSECASVREFLDHRGYETAGCTVMSYPQEDAFLLRVGDLPRVKVRYIPAPHQESWPYYDRLPGSIERAQPTQGPSYHVVESPVRVPQHSRYSQKEHTRHPWPYKTRRR